MRIVAPEILDHLPAEATEARASRLDLVRVNRLMRHTQLIREQLPPCITCVVDLGAGDGTLALSVVQNHRAPVKHVVLVDRQRVVGEMTLHEFKRAEIEVEVAVQDVFHWLQQSHRNASTAIIANLFLHHFETSELQKLLSLATSACDAFIACEPRRGRWPAFAASLLGLIGCNRVTRHDARISVRAGFRGRELSMLWPKDDSWRLHEQEAGLFSHLFVAQKL